MDTTNFDRDQELDDLGQNDNRTQRTDRERDREQSGYQQGNTGGNGTSDSSFSNQDWKSQWPDIENDYRRRYPSLTEEDVDYSDGDFDSMSDRIAKRTNRNYQDVQHEISNWNTGVGNSNASEDRSPNEGDADFDRISRR